MVPLLAVIFSFFSIFPFFEKLKEEVEEFVFNNFVPALGEVVQEQILSFVDNATRMTPFGLMEVAAYSIAMSRSYIFIHKIVKKIPIRNDIRVTLVEILILLGLLLTGGYVEWYMIEMSSQI